MYYGGSQIILFLAPLIGFVLVVYVIIRLIHHFLTPPEKRPSLTLDQLKKGAVVIALVILLPTFINLTVAAITPSSDDNIGFVLAIGFSLAVLLAGLAARRNRVVAGSITTGGLISLMYAIGVRYPYLDAWVKALITGLGLIVITIGAYWFSAKYHDPSLLKPSLHVFKSIVVGLIIYILAMMFVVNLNAVLNPLPSLPTPVPLYKGGCASTRLENTGIQKTCIENIGPSTPIDYPAPYSDDSFPSYQAAQQTQERNSFIIVMVVSLIYLIIGVIIRAVGSVSAGFVLAGLTSVIYTLVISFDILGQAALAIITGLGVIALIILAYWKFGHEEPTKTV